MTAPPDRPRNELELALAAGITDEAARPHFYGTLLKSQILIVHVGEMPSAVAGVIQADTPLSLPMIEIDGEPHVPFFSSEARLPVGTPFIELSAIDFFRIVSGANVVLNPGSSDGKAFSANEIASLLDGSLFEPTETLIPKAGERQTISRPKDYPHKFAAAVSRSLASEPGVELAFLPQHVIEGRHTQPLLLVAVLAPEVGFDRIASAIGIIAKETLKGEGAVDVTRLQKKDLGYYAKQARIYERKKKSLLSRLFG
ncbi:MAG TPA: enhanced serine sensitivity protein SseB C-terminal domain-containing protein [Longimicrobium sp.]|jgi:hypothetical protein